MHGTRLIGLLISFIMMWGVATIGNLPLFPLLAIASFVLAVDAMIVRALSALYMKSVLDQMTKENDDSTDIK